MKLWQKVDFVKGGKKIKKYKSLDKPEKRMLVHLHIYYHDQIDYMLRKLKHISGCKWDLYVTLCEKNKESIDKILAFNPDANIIKVENRGYDVWPFIQVLRKVDLKNYDYVLKLHTKAFYKTPSHIRDLWFSGFQWRDSLINAILGSDRIFKNNMQVLEQDKTIGLVGDENFFIPLLKFAEDTYLLQRLKQRLNIKSHYDKFIAGTVFIIRSNLLEGLRNSDICKQEFPLYGETSTRATLAHSLERIFTILTVDAGYKIYTRKGLDLNKVSSGKGLKQKLVNLFYHIFNKQEFTKNGKRIKKYKFCGITLLRKEKSNTKKKWNILGIRLSKHIRSLEKVVLGINPKYIDLVSNSQFFDADWYNHYHKHFLKLGENTAAHYLRSRTLNPGPEFYTSEYLLLHPDVAANKMNPLFHYEQWGWKEKRAISLADFKPYKFPDGTETVKVENFARDSKKHKMVSVFASFSGDGKIADYVVYLLKNLETVSDYIIFVADNPIFKEELAKIKDYCNVCLCERHEEYDFGSYKRGYQYLVEHKILQKNDNLLMINDANYGPMYPFNEVIEDFNHKDCDFYGLSISRAPKRHLQSFFYIFKSKVYKSAVFSKFLQSVRREISSANVVFRYEMNFTEVLNNVGFSYDSYVDDNKLLPSQKEIIPTKWTHTLLRDFRYPLVKIKALQGSTMEKPEDILEYVKQENKELYDIILPHITKKLAGVKHRPNQKVSPYTLHEEYAESLAKLKQKVTDGQKIQVTFLVNMTSMFPAEQVMNLMRQDKLFDVALYIIPDTRFGEVKMYEMMQDAYNELHQKYDFAQLAVTLDENDKIIEWKRVVDDADIVFYPSPYDLSYSLYNPYYAAQNGILSVQLDYGFYRSKYDRFIYQLDNYNNFWRTYIETELNREEYAEYGRCKASNAVITGYAKMDKLAEYMQNRRKKRRKTIMIAPHHSVEGGTNDMLSLSNFVRYADLFLKLPEMYPNIDFIFRPHPVLFTVLSWGRHWGAERVEQYIAAMKAHKNVVYSTEGDYLEQFAQSDGIIQDCGSYLVEYLYTQKPGCYMLKSPADIDAKFAELGKQCLEQYYISYNEQDILDYIDNVIIKGEDPKKEQREKFAREVVMVNYPHASEKVVEEIKKELGRK